MKPIKYLSFLTLLILIGSIASPRASAEDYVRADLDQPRPLQSLAINGGPAILYPEDLVSIVHPPSGAVNFKESDAGQVKMVIDGEDFFVNVDDFILTPGEKISTNADFYAAGLNIAGIHINSPFFPGKSRFLYIADVRDPVAGEVPIVPPVIYMDGLTDPYDKIYPNIPLTVDAPAYSLSKVFSKSSGSYDIAMVSYGNAEIDDNGQKKTISSPVFYLKTDDKGLYRLAGVLGDPGWPVKNEDAVSVEVLDVGGDGIDDIVVVGRRPGGDAKINVMTGNAPGWTDINKGFVPPITVKVEEIKYPFDAAVMSDRLGGKIVDALIVPSFYKDSNGNYEAIKAFQGTQSHIYLGTPPFIADPKNCGGKRCGPVRIECTRYGYTTTGENFDLNNDGCGDCVVTWGRLMKDANGLYLDLFNSFTVYSSKREGESCSTQYELHTYEVGAVMPSKYFSDPVKLTGIEPVRAFAIEITDANGDGKPDVWIGDQSLYSNNDTGRYDSLVYLFRNASLGAGNIDFLAFPNEVQFFKANYSNSYVNENYAGGGIKAIAADRFGNVGVINGYPFVPYKVTVPEVKFECDRDLDKDEWGDRLPAAIDMNGDGVNDVFLDPDGNSVVTAEEQANMAKYVECDTCIPEGTYSPSMNNPDAVVCNESVPYDGCKNSKDADGNWSDVIPTGCAEGACPARSLCTSEDIMEIVNIYKKIDSGTATNEEKEQFKGFVFFLGLFKVDVKALFDEWVDGIDLKKSIADFEKNFGEDNDSNKNCIPDCGVSINIDDIAYVLYKCDADFEGRCGCSKDSPRCTYIDEDTYATASAAPIQFDGVKFNKKYDADQDCLIDCAYWKSESPSPEGSAPQDQKFMICDGDVDGMLPTCCAKERPKCPSGSETYAITSDSFGTPFTNDMDADCVPDCLNGSACDDSLDCTNYFWADPACEKGVPMCKIPLPSSPKLPDVLPPIDLKIFEQILDQGQGGFLETAPDRPSVFSFLSDLLIPSAEASNVSRETLGTKKGAVSAADLPTASEPTVLINKITAKAKPHCEIHPDDLAICVCPANPADPRCATDFCKEHPDDPKCQVTPPSGSLMQKCTVDVDRYELEGNEYKPFREYVRALNDRYREITGLDIDIFIPEYVGTYKATLYQPVSEVALKADVTKGTYQMFQPVYYSGMKIQNYQAMSLRPVYTDNTSKDTLLVPTAKMQSIMPYPGLSPNVAMMPDYAVKNPSGSTFIVGDMMSITFSAVEGGGRQDLSTDVSMLTPAKTIFAGVAGMDGCAWEGYDCPTAIPPREVRGEDPAAILNTAEGLVSPLKNEGRPVSPDIIKDVLAKTRWDSTGYLEMNFSFLPPGSADLSTAEYSEAIAAKTTGVGMTGDVQEKPLVAGTFNEVMNANIAAAKEKGLGCDGFTLLMVPMDMNAQGAGCKCNMMLGKPRTADIVAYLLSALFVATLVVIRRRRRT